MIKRILDCDASDFAQMDGRALVKSIRAAEGRTIVAEVIAITPPLFPPISNAELAASFGADLILLNMFDVFQPYVAGVPVEEASQTVAQLRRLIGRPIGLNLEPVDADAEGLEELLSIPKGRRAEKETYEQVKTLGVDFLCLTGNPKTGVTHRSLIQAVRTAREVLGLETMIFAGKMHSAGVSGESGEGIVEASFLKELTAAGADVVLLPAPGTIPGVTVERTAAWVKIVHAQGALAMLTVGTSQESADPETIRSIALMGKMSGADLFHIGDGGPGGVAPPENVMAFSLAIRGRRHTYRRMAASPLR